VPATAVPQLPADSGAGLILAVPLPLAVYFHDGGVVLAAGERHFRYRTRRWLGCGWARSTGRLAGGAVHRLVWARHVARRLTAAFCWRYIQLSAPGGARQPFSLGVASIVPPLSSRVSLAGTGYADSRNQYLPPPAARIPDFTPPVPDLRVNLEAPVTLGHWSAPP
jgi:hypothetical protein